MAIFNPGTSSLNATTYEEALHQAIQLYITHAPDGENEATMSIVDHASKVECTIVLPLTILQLSDGGIQIKAIDNSDYDWVADVASDASADSLASQIFSIAAKINAGQKITNAQGSPDRCQLSISTDSKLATIATEFRLQQASAAPALTFGITPYIQDFTA